MEKEPHRKEVVAIVRLTKDYIEQIAAENSVYIPRGWLLLLGNNGTAVLNINQNQRKIQHNTLLATLPNQVLSLIKCSIDIDITAIFIPHQLTLFLSNHINSPQVIENFWQQVDVTKIYNLIDENDGEASVGNRITDANADDLRKIIEVLDHQSNHDSFPANSLQALLVEAIILLVINSLTNSQHPHKPAIKQSSLVKRFFTELLINYKEHHEVAYYAQKLNISTKYLSTLVKEETGIPALQWINKLVMFGAKKMLKSTNKSVAEISNDLHFSSASAFIRFFKTQSGTTPLAYKN